MTITFAPTALGIALCVVASGLGALVYWYTFKRRAWESWQSFWFGVFVALLILISFKIG